VRARRRETDRIARAIAVRILFTRAIARDRTLSGVRDARNTSAARGRSRRPTAGESQDAIAPTRIGIPAHAHFYNVCPSRFLLRRPRRRLQGDQDPSAYFLAFARRATTRGTTTRARDAIASRAIDRRREIRDIARAARIASSRRGTCDAAKGVAGSDVDDYL